MEDLASPTVQQAMKEAIRVNTCLDHTTPFGEDKDKKR